MESVGQYEPLLRYIQIVHSMIRIIYIYIFIDLNGLNMCRNFYLLFDHGLAIRRHPQDVVTLHPPLDTSHRMQEVSIFGGQKPMVCCRFSFQPQQDPN